MEGAERPHGFLLPRWSGSALCILSVTYSIAYIVSNLSTPNLDQMKIRQLTDIKYFQKKFFCSDLVWSLTKLKNAVVILSKLVNSSKEEILSHFFGKQLKTHF